MSEYTELDLLIEWREAQGAFLAAKALRGTPDFNEDVYRSTKTKMSELRTFWRQVREAVWAEALVGLDGVVRPEPVSTSVQEG